MSHQYHLGSSKLDEPTDNLMKKRSLRPTSSSWGCVETKSHGTNVPQSCVRVCTEECDVERCTLSTSASNFFPLSEHGKVESLGA